jgi:hypothetical protein
MDDAEGGRKRQAMSEGMNDWKRERERQRVEANCNK